MDSEFPNWRSHARRVLAIWGLLFIAYSNCFQAGLVFDNSAAIGQDPRIRHAAAQTVASILTRGYRPGTTDGLYRPLTTLSFLLNYTVFGDGTRPMGYHWVNLAMHGANVALVYALGILVFGEIAPAWALAAIWGVHPLLTEAITNIVGRADLLAAFGVLAGMVCYMKAGSAAGRRRWGWLAGVAAAQAVGIFSKESAVVLPGIMLLYDLMWPKGMTWRVRVRSYAAVALPLAAFFYLRSPLHLQLAVAFADNPLVKAGFWEARLTAVKVIGRFLWLFLWPARLSADYSYNAVPLGTDFEVLLTLGVCVAGALLCHRAGRPMTFFLALFFVAGLPTANLIVLIGSIMAERFVYLPSVGLAGCVVAGIHALAWWKRWYAHAGLAMVCLALASRTYARNSDWKDELSLWTSAVSVCPGSAKAHYNLGKALEVLPGRTQDAVAEYRESLRIDPDHADVHNNLANALAAIPGRLPEAIAEYETALRLDPDRAEPHNDLANALVHLPERLPEAIAEYRAALRLRPDTAEIHYNLANALLQQPGGVTQAIDEYRAALRIDPNHADAHTNLGNALMRLPGRKQEAIAEYRAALRVDPGSVGAHIGLGNALSTIPGGDSEAIAEYREALRIRPDHAEAHYDLGTALAGAPGGLPEAIAEFRLALQNQPDLFEAHVNLANALAQTPAGIAEAIREYDAALRLRAEPVVRQMANRLRTKR